MVELLPTYSRRMQILDVSSILYTYTATSQYVRDRHAVTVKGVNVAGVKAVIEMMGRAYINNYRVVLCMDSFSDKRKANSEYKSNRVFHPEIAVQSEIISTYFNKFGIDVLKSSGKEADDLIYSTVMSNVDDYIEMNIITADQDIYGAVIAPHVSIIGSNSRAPSITIDNYEDCVSSKTKIPYNCVLPYIVFFGKPSNALKKLPIDNKNTEYFDKFCQYVSENNLKTHGSEVETLIAFLETGAVDSRHIDTIVERALLVYPRIDYVPINKRAEEIDVEALCSFLNFFNQPMAANLYGLQRVYQTVPIDKSMNSMMKRLYNTVSTGTIAADRGLRQESGTPLISYTNEFEEVEQW